MCIRDSLPPHLFNSPSFPHIHSHAPRCPSFTRNNSTLRVKHFPSFFLKSLYTEQRPSRIKAFFVSATLILIFDVQRICLVQGTWTALLLPPCCPPHRSMQYLSFLPFPAYYRTFCLLLFLLVHTLLPSLSTSSQWTRPSSNLLFLFYPYSNCLLYTSRCV